MRKFLMMVAIVAVAAATPPYVTKVLQQSSLRAFWPHSTDTSHIDLKSGLAISWEGGVTFEPTARGPHTPTTAQGKWGRVAYNAALAPPSAFTLEMWLYKESGAVTNDHHCPLMNRWETGSSPNYDLRGFNLYVLPNSQLWQGWSGRGAAGGWDKVTGPVAQNNVWQHVVFTVTNGGTGRLYINGAVVGSTANMGYVPSPTNDMAIAAAHGGLFRWDGHVGSTAIYGSELSSGTIAQHYQASPREPVADNYNLRVLGDDPAVFWTFEDAGNTQYDHVQNYPGVFQNGVTREAKAPYTRAIPRYQMSSQYTSVTYSPIFNKKHFTAEFWFYKEAGGEGGWLCPTMNRWQTGSSPSYDLRGWNLYIGETSNRWEAWTGPGPNTPGWHTALGPTYTNNAWQHIVFKAEGDQGIHLYINGQLVTSNAGARHVPSPANAMTIGSGHGGWASMNAYIPSFAVYNYALTPAQITDHYQGDILPPTPVPPPTPNPATCQGACLLNGCTSTGQLIEVTVTGASSNQLWGGPSYTDDSDVGAAAVHAGEVTVGETKAITVRCAGPQQAFVGSEANGITSQSFGLWSASFSFDLSGQTPAPPPPAPEICYHEPCVHNKCAVQGTTLDIIVTGATSGNLVWGDGIFTDDSNVGTAAVFKGLLQSGESGAVTVECTGPQTNFPSRTAHGVTTSAYNQPWSYTFQLKAGPPTPPAPSSAVCAEGCVHNGCVEGAVHRIRVTGTTFGYAWGSGPFTDDSHVGLVAVHAGLVTAGNTKEILVTCAGAAPSFTGSTAHGVTTKSYTAWPSSFTLSAATNPTPSPCSGACLLNACTIKGKVLYVSLTGTTSGSIWGTSIYSDDSLPSTAAVHAGLLAAGETKTFAATCTGSQSSFEATTNAGISSQPYGPWGYSYTLEVVQ